MQKKFKYSLCVKLTYIEAIDLARDLKELGYDISDTEISRSFPILTTNYNGVKGVIAAIVDERKSSEGRIYFDTYNKDLILALAAMVDDNEAHIGEIWCYGKSSGELYQIKSLAPAWNLKHISTHGRIEPYRSSPATITHSFRKATKEEIIAHFTKAPVTKEPEFVLPEKWYVVRNRENYTILNRWENKRQGDTGAYLGSKAYFYSDRKYNDNSADLKNYTEITFEQFKKYVLKQETTTMEKKVIGYKFKPGMEKYAAAVAKITEATPNRNTIIAGNAQQRLMEAGVLDVWFDEVYEEEFEIGDLITVDESSWPYGVVKLLNVNNTYFSSKEHRWGRDSVYGSKTRKATSQEVDDYNSVKLAGYKVEKGGYNGSSADGHAGCFDFNIADVEFMIKMLEKGEARAKLTLAGEEVTVEKLKRILDIIS